MSGFDRLYLAGSRLLVVLSAVLVAEILRPAMLPSIPTDFLPFSAVIWLACRHGALAGVALGTLAGAFGDLLGEMALGVHAGPMALTGFLFGKVFRMLWLWGNGVRAAALAALSVLYIPFLQVFSALAGLSITWNFIAVRNLTIANGICALLILVSLSPDRGSRPVLAH